MLRGLGIRQCIFHMRLRHFGIWNDWSSSMQQTHPPKTQPKHLKKSARKTMRVAERRTRHRHAGPDVMQSVCVLGVIVDRPRHGLVKGLWIYTPGGFPPAPVKGQVSYGGKGLHELPRHVGDE